MLYAYNAYQPIISLLEQGYCSRISRGNYRAHQSKIYRTLQQNSPTTFFASLYFFEISPSCKSWQILPPAVLRRRYGPLRAGCWSPPARECCVGRWRQVMVEQVRHTMDAALLIDAAVHLADQGVPLLPPRPPLPSLPPPPLLAQPSFHAARTSLQPTNRASIPTILPLTPSLHHNNLTIIWSPDYVLPLCCAGAD